MTNDWDLIDDAARRARAYLESTREVRVAPAHHAVDALAEFDDELPADPAPGAATIAHLDRFGSPATVHTNGGRYFGFVNGGTNPVGLAAAMVAAAWDQNAALPVMSPVAARLDEIAGRWIVDLLGIPASATAAFCAGASIANLTAIVTARDALLRRVGWDPAEQGLAGAPSIDVVASEEIHTSVRKALRVAGIGTGAIRPIPTDAFGRARADAVPATDGPKLVLLQAGNVNTGSSDPFDEIADGLDRDRCWMHVDGAFGLWANAAPDRRPFVSGVELADSWAVDGHKWLNTPYDCGVTIVARPDELAASMTMDAAYASGGAGRSPMNLGLQMSQAARAVPVWAVLASLGRSGVADLVERCCAHAERFGLLLEAGGAEVLAPPVLNQVLVAFGDDDTTDRVVLGVQGDGTCWMGATTWKGRRAMRISVSDMATTEVDIERSAEAVLRVWNDVA
ncbi:MAG: pyridoxal phosphate-dependent decarboxylase family protein [Ilumatobacteraceae bacterium]